jgi:hypothetical protein
MRHTGRGLNIGIVQTTWVRAATPGFEITSEDGKLVADHAVDGAAGTSTTCQPGNADEAQAAQLHFVARPRSRA